MKYHSYWIDVELSENFAGYVAYFFDAKGDLKYSKPFADKADAEEFVDYMRDIGDLV